MEQGDECVAVRGHPQMGQLMQHEVVEAGHAHFAPVPGSQDAAALFN